MAVLMCGVGGGTPTRSSVTHTRNTTKAPLVVWGGTVAGIAAAVSFVRTAPRGCTSLILLDNDHLGGMTTGGLSGIDGPSYPVGGIAAEIIAGISNCDLPSLRAGAHPTCSTEARRASAFLAEMLSQYPNITVLRNVSHLSTVLIGSSGRIVSVTTASGATFSGDYWVDASYEGDLLRLAGVNYTVGREPAAQYNETAGGVQLSWGDIPSSVNPFTDETNSTLLPLIDRWDGVGVGGGDDKVQSMTYRLCVTNTSDNRVTFPMPTRFDPATYTLVGRWIAALSPAARSALTMHRYFLMREIVTTGGKHTGKWDLNSAVDANNGLAAPVGVDAPGLQFGYPLGNATTRANTRTAHVDYITGLLRYLSTSNDVPSTLRAEVAAYGLCQDEFINTAHWPPQLYVRESIRMVGDVVLTQADVSRGSASCKKRSVSLSSWGLDVHLVQRTVSGGVGDHVAPSNGPGSLRVINEGRPLLDADKNSGHAIAEVPYDVLVPARDGCGANLFVPVCLSASHVAFTTFRMETQYASAGHAVGVAAALAVSQGGVSVHDVDVTVLQRELELQGVVLRSPECSAVPPTPPTPGPHGESYTCGASRCFVPDTPRAPRYSNNSCDGVCSPLASDEWLAYRAHWAVTDNGKKLTATSSTALKKSEIQQTRPVAAGTVIPLAMPPVVADTSYWLVTLL